MSELPVMLLGAGGHAREIASSLLRAAGGRASAFAGLLADWVPPTTATTGFGSHHLGPIALLNELPCRYLVAIGNPLDRRRVAREVEKSGMLVATVIDPTSLVGERIHIGRGVYIAAGAIVTVDAELGDHVHLNVRCSVHHDVRISSYSTIGPGSVLCGAVYVGEAVEIGAGVTVLPGVRIGDEAVIGAGAVVVRDVEPGSVVVGVPARPQPT